MADSADTADSDSGFNASSALDAPDSGGIDYEAGTAPIPIDWPSFSGLPSREDIDAARNTWQFTPDEINAEIDRLRPLTSAAGFSDQEVDDYYGIKRFDWQGAASELNVAAQKAQDSVVDPQLLINDIKSNFLDPQAQKQTDDEGFDWKGLGAQVGSAVQKAMEFRSSPMAKSILESEDPLLIPMLNSGSLMPARTSARLQLVQCYKTGDCSDPYGFRKQMLQAYSSLKNLVNDPDKWLNDAIQGIMTNSWTRSWLADEPGIDSLSNVSREQAATFLWALYDKEMPKAQDFYNAAFTVWAHAKKAVGTQECESKPADTPDYSQLGNFVRNVQDAYSGYGITPDKWLNNALQDPNLIKDALSSEQVHKATQFVIGALPKVAGVIGDFDDDGDDFDTSDDANDGGVEEENSDSGYERNVDEDYIRVRDEMHNHHPWPEYLLGPKDQEFYRVPKIWHDDYHYEMQEIAPYDWDYKNMDKDELMEIYREFAEATEEYDQATGETQFYDHLIGSNFPVK